MLARRALDLFSAQPLVTLQVLIAMRAGKFELAHAGSLAEFPKRTMPGFVKVSCRQLRQRVVAILDAASQFFHAVRSGRDLVLELNRRLDVPLVVANGAQHFHNRGVALAERRVRPVVLLPIPPVDMRDALVVFADEW